jgi:hypothetical protein
MGGEKGDVCTNRRRPPAGGGRVPAALPQGPLITTVQEDDEDVILLDSRDKLLRRPQSIPFSPRSPIPLRTYLSS